MLKVFAETAAPAATAVSEAAAAASGAPVPGEGGIMALITSMLPMILLIAVFYFILIRPQRKKDKENREMLAALKVGDKIVTIGGIVGTIVKVKDEKLVIEIGTAQDKQPMTIERWAVRSVEKAAKISAKAQAKLEEKAAEEQAAPEATEEIETKAE